MAQIFPYEAQKSAILIPSFLYLVGRTRIIKLQIHLADVNKEVPSYLIAKTMSGNPQETTENTRMLQWKCSDAKLGVCIGSR